MGCVKNALQSVAGTKVYEQTFYLGTGTIAKNQYVSRTKTTANQDLYYWECGPNGGPTIWTYIFPFWINSIEILVLHY